MTVNSYYIPPNQPFAFRSSATDTPLQVKMGDYNSHSTEWRYKSSNDNGTLVERWRDANRLSLIQLPNSFNSARWKQGYKPALSFVSTSIAHQCEKLVLEVILKSQHRPIAIKPKVAIAHMKFPSEKQHNIHEADWEYVAKSVDAKS